MILNRIRDSRNPNFRDPDYIPYLKEDRGITVLRSTADDKMAAKIPVITYTQEVPVLREEYGTLDYYELVHFLPVSLWKQIKTPIGGAEEDFYIRVLAGENAAMDELDRFVYCLLSLESAMCFPIRWGLCASEDGNLPVICPWG